MKNNMKTTTACLDCIHFKYKKGWKVAHCSKDFLTYDNGDKRLFKDEVGGGNCRGGSKKLMERGRILKALNKKCDYWTDDITLQINTLNFSEIFNIIKRIV